MVLYNVCRTYAYVMSELPTPYPMCIKILGPTRDDPNTHINHLKIHSAPVNFQYT